MARRCWPHAMKFAEVTESKLLVLHTAAGRVGAMDAGCTTDGGMSAAIKGAEVIYNLGADEVEIADGPFVIYQGSHGDRGAHRADIILPAAAYTEEQGLFVNTEGRPQLALRASFPPGEAKENWAILRALSAELGATLPYDSLAALRRALVKDVPHLGKIDKVPTNDWQPLPLKDPGRGAVPLCDQGFLPDQPDCARQPADGRAQRERPRPGRNPDRGGVTLAPAPCKVMAVLACSGLMACEPSGDVTRDAFRPDYTRDRDPAAGRRSGQVSGPDAGRARQRGCRGLCRMRRGAVCADPRLRICATFAHKCLRRGWHLARQMRFTRSHRRCRAASARSMPR